MLLFFKKHYSIFIKIDTISSHRQTMNTLLIAVCFILCPDEFWKIPVVIRHYRSKKWLNDITRDLQTSCTDDHP